VILDFITAILYLAIIYVLVRPGSPAANVIKTITQTLVSVVGEATGSSALGGSSGSGTSTGAVNA
jgi:hypothetical protein